MTLAAFRDQLGDWLEVDCLVVVPCQVLWPCWAHTCPAAVPDTKGVGDPDRSASWRGRVPRGAPGVGWGAVWEAGDPARRAREAFVSSAWRELRPVVRKGAGRWLGVRIQG